MPAAKKDDVSAASLGVIAVVGSILTLVLVYVTIAVMNTEIRDNTAAKYPAVHKPLAAMQKEHASDLADIDAAMAEVVKTKGE
ncbi:MAG: hypothetical protein HN405_03740 [Planctomycetes bacterium]|jgi:type II secretory pathway component PulM|nr:hypothetical protein [Planctomycetota bacterium]MBT4029820.1 hypothetical protein [Planctomycetota bacterium]MBT4559914.1 hypothetical protein [Planctomycetota bacterium]MBT5100868.1 hypothetical protein [Planctomycetota bacterium]MBT7012262.1 hypothetical protein [Planctomycetota bacterium]